jgi:uncharacterized membrane protein YGL010W
MAASGKLMEMLTGYAAAHQHPFNIFVHMLGIPTIMFGVLVPLTWVTFGVAGMELSLAQLVVAGFFLFYLTLDRLFAVVFLVAAMLIAAFAARVGSLPLPISGGVAALAFFGGYAAQFVGHAVEKSMPVLVRHPVQANLAAPFFTVVELFKLLGLRDGLFREVQAQVAAMQRRQAG